jgi:flagellar motor switch protein FliN/FliY
VSTLDNLNVDLTVLLGRSRMPVHMLLRMGRGAVIELESTETDMVDILANGHPIARGQIIVTGTRISVEVTELIKKPPVVREPGVRIGDSYIAAEAAAEEPAPIDPAPAEPAE